MTTIFNMWTYLLPDLEGSLKESVDGMPYGESPWAWAHAPTPRRPSHPLTLLPILGEHVLRMFAKCHGRRQSSFNFLIFKNPHMVDHQQHTTCLPALPLIQSTESTAHCKRSMQIINVSGSYVIKNDVFLSVEIQRLQRHCYALVLEANQKMQWCQTLV